MKFPMAKRWLTVAACLGVAALVSGCSGFWNATTTTTTTTLTSKDFYILNSSGQIYGAYINAGTLTALSGSPYTVTGTPYAMAITPDGSYAYVATSEGIYYLSINSSTGALTAEGIVYTDPEALALAVDPSGEWLLDASSQGVLIAIPISSGAYDKTRSVQTSTTLTSVNVKSIAVTPSTSNGWVFVALGTSGTNAFKFDYTSTSTPLATSGALIKPYNTTSSGSALSVAVDPSSRLLYIGEFQAFPSSTTSSGGLRAFTISTSTLTELSGSPYASGGTGPNAILPESGGSYVYVANSNGTSKGNITGFTVSTSALTKLSSSVSTGNIPKGLVEDASGNFVLAVNGTGSTSLDAYYFDTTTSGQLDLSITATTSTTGSSPVTVVALP
jgi:6-phosphogluconolactonase (cycloisomerase 2 family)